MISPSSTQATSTTIGSFQDTMDALQQFGVAEEEMKNVLNTLAVILHLSNLEFNSVKRGDGVEGSEVNKGDFNTLQHVADLLSVTARQLE